MGEVLRRADAADPARRAGGLRALPGGAASARTRRTPKRQGSQTSGTTLRRHALDAPADELTWLLDVVLDAQARADATEALLDLMTPDAVAAAVDRLSPSAAVAWMRSCDVVVHKRPGVLHVRDSARVLRGDLRVGESERMRGLLGPALDVALVALGSDDLVRYLADSGAGTCLLKAAGGDDDAVSWQAEVLQDYDALPVELRPAALLAITSAAGSTSPAPSTVLEAVVSSFALASWNGAPLPELVDAAAYALGRVEELDVELVETGTRVPPASECELEAELADVRRDRDKLAAKAGYLKGELAAVRHQAREAAENTDRELWRLRRELEAAEQQVGRASGRVAELESQDHLLLRMEAEDEAAQTRRNLEVLQDEHDDLISRLLRIQTQRVCRVAHTEAETEDVAEEPLPDVITCVDAVAVGARLFSDLELQLALEPTRALDEYGARAKPWAGKALLVLGALQDYVEVKREGFDGDVSNYLRNTPPGRRNIPLRWYAGGDTAPRAEHRAARTFPMPYWFNGGEPLYCPAHIRLDIGGRPAPRLHLYDDTGGPSRTVWVAYLGKHLPNGEKA